MDIKKLNCVKCIEYLEKVRDNLLLVRDNGYQSDMEEIDRISSLRSEHIVNLEELKRDIFVGKNRIDEYVSELALLIDLQNKINVIRAKHKNIGICDVLSSSRTIISCHHN